MDNIQTPSFAEEAALAAQGCHYIAGIDEVGCGALAGPVVAAAVILDHTMNTPWLRQVNDSKLLTPKKRESLYLRIRKAAVSVGVGVTPHKIIDSRGLTKARRMAMQQAIEQLSPQPESLLIDYMLLPDVAIPQKGITRGDRLSFSIACASIIAKVTRDRLMVKLDGAYQNYGMAKHKGYGTREHLVRLRELGPCPIHRRSFRPVREAMEI